jgi:hypothetical protein
MDKAKIEKLLELISDIVRSDGSWQEKRDAILEVADEDVEGHLLEFASWFEE